MIGRLGISVCVIVTVGIVLSPVTGVVVASSIQEEEPNDEFGTAQPISEGEVVARITDGESDFYAIEGDTTDALDLTITPRNGDVEVHVYDGSHTPLGEAFVGEGEVERLVRTLTDSDVHYIEVVGGAADTTTEYTLDYQRITPDENDQFAPNGDFVSASTLPEGSSMAKIWGGESDFYAIEADSTDAMDLEVTPRNGDVRVRIYDGRREMLAEAFVGAGDSDRIVRKLTDSDVHYVEVVGEYPGTTTEYRIRYTRITPSKNDAFAPNGGFRSATVLPEGTNEAKIWGGESDFYELRANTTDAVALRLTSDSGDVRLRMYDGRREMLAETFVGDGDVDRLVRKLTDTEVHYVEVVGDYPGTTTEYRLEYDKISPAENDQFAPNDDFSSAAPITNRSIEAKIWGGESDFYAIRTTTAGAVALRLAPDSGDVRLRVYDGQREVLAEEFVGDGDVDRLVRTLTDSDVHYIEVVGDHAGTTTEYELQSNLTTAVVSTSPPGTAPPRQSPPPTQPDRDPESSESGIQQPEPTNTNGGSIDETDLWQVLVFASVITSILGYGMVDLWKDLNSDTDEGR